MAGEDEAIQKIIENPAQSPVIAAIAILSTDLRGFKDHVLNLLEQNKQHYICLIEQNQKRIEAIDNPKDGALIQMGRRIDANQRWMIGLGVMVLVAVITLVVSKL